MGGDKQEVKELRVLFGFTPGQVLINVGCDCVRLDLARVGLVQISLSLLVMVAYGKLRLLDSSATL